MLSNWQPDGQAEEPPCFEEGDELYVHLGLSIVDTGIGISPEGVSNLFIDFSKLQENSSRNRSGTGLGLSICKKIIEQMGGKVEVESVLNKGTSFNISIKTKCIIKKTEFASEACKPKDDQDSFVFIDKNPQTEELNPLIKVSETFVFD